ncbi:MAG: exosortase/archaeosortase family protein [Opitutaceae bacterium]|nr:exosortase/archaeosortase family protein [Opitutaceae bacterium]
MNPRRLVVLALAVLTAAFVWLRDLSWWAESPDALSLLAGVGLYAWFGQPWRWRAEARPLAVGVVAAGLGLFLVGSLTDATLLLALGWCVAWQAWLAAELAEDAPAAGPRLVALLFCAFPWVAVGGQSIGWWFRYSGAAATELFFRLTGLAVDREGTFLLVQGQPLSVDPACAGLNVLQAMLLAGVVLAQLKLTPVRWYWTGLALLVPLAWLANTVRIVTLGVAGVTFGADAARGWFHHWGGWTVLCLMFALTYATFAGLARLAARKP